MEICPPEAGLPGELPTLCFEGQRLCSGVEDRLYGSPDFRFSPQRFKAVPYGLWCNREPGEMLVFEDALYSIKSAKAAGCPVLGILDDTQKHDWEEIKALSDHVIRAYEELL